MTTRVLDGDGKVSVPVGSVDKKVNLVDNKANSG